MTDLNIKTAEDLANYVRQKVLDYVKMGVFDVDGILRGKYLAQDKFFSSLEHGFGFCDVVLGWDSNDQLYDNTTFTGWHTAYPDALCRILPATCRSLPEEGDMVFFLGEFTGRAEEVCPRGTLRRVLQRAADMGLSVTSSVEFEFFVFEETPHSVREKNYRNLRSLTPGFFGYSLLRAGVHDDYYRDLLAMCETMRMPIEGLHTETGPGVLEAALRYSEALEAADRAALFKTFTKIFSQKRGLMATFMAKWSRDWPGQSGHLHVSLKDQSGRAVFHDPEKPHGISDAMRHFLGGQLTLMPELLAMIASTVNSYRRLIPGFWAPTVAAWGVENRTCALRAIPGSPSSQRIEYRIAAADINPYLALAAAIGSGLWGIEHESSPTRRSSATPMSARFRPNASCRVRLGGGGAPQASEGGARIIRRALRRTLRGDARMGRSGIAQGDHRLGTRPLFRDHLMLTRGSQADAES